MPSTHACKTCYDEAVKSAKENGTTDYLSIICDCPDTVPTSSPDSEALYLKDGSTVIEFSKQHFNSFHNGNNGREWDEVYGITKRDNTTPAGTFYNTGTGIFIVVSEDGLYEYCTNWGFAPNVKHYPRSVLLIRHVKQSDCAHIDDYITYIRILTG